MSTVKIILMITGYLSLLTCSNNEQLAPIHGLPAPGPVITNTLIPVTLIPAAEYALDLYFNYRVPESLLNSNYFVFSGGNAILLGITSGDSSNVIRFYISNYNISDTYSIRTCTTNFQEIQENASGYDQTNHIDVIGNLQQTQAFGTEDSTPPLLTIFYPETVVDINIGINEKLSVFGYAWDEVGISKIEFSIDNGSYSMVSDARFQVAVNSYSLGQHQLLVRASDLKGNATVKNLQFNIVNFVPAFQLVSPTLQNPFIFSAVTPVKIKAVSSAANIFKIKIKTVTQHAQYGFFDMNHITGQEWQYNQALSEQDGGVCTLIGMLIITNGVGVPFTNYISNQALLYNDKIYCSLNGNDNNYGTMLEPVATLSHAMDLASSLGLDKVLISGGSFGSISVNKNGLNLQGGYSPDFSVYDPGVYITELRTLNLLGRQNCYISDITLKGGNPGLKIENSTGLILSNMVVKNCVQGINIRYSQVKFDKFSIQDNKADRLSGIGIGMNNSHIEMINSLISNNQWLTTFSSTYGGGIFSINCYNVFLSNNNFIGNHSEHGAALYLTGVQKAVFINNRFYGNSSYHCGGAISVYNSSVWMTNNRIINNYCEPFPGRQPSSILQGGGIYFYQKFLLIKGGEISSNSLWGIKGSGTGTGILQTWNITNEFNLPGFINY